MTGWCEIYRVELSGEATYACDTHRVVFEISEQELPPLKCPRAARQRRPLLVASVLLLLSYGGLLLAAVLAAVLRLLGMWRP